MDPLSLPLRDIHMPPAPGWWPLAPGWWLVIAVLVVLLATAIVFGLAWRRRRRTVQHRVRRELKRLRREFKRSGDAENLLQQLSVLTRRALITQVGRRDVAAVAGDDWLALLDGADPARPFSAGVGRILADGPYRRPGHAVNDINGDALLTLVERRLIEAAGR
ncbi:MAG: DUF4381 domain-containing protein [Pseudomonadota bacterium]